MNFASGLQNFGDRPALILPDGTQYTYRELARCADAIYNESSAPQVNRTLVAIECENSLNTISAYLGALRNGFPALLVNAQLAPAFRETLYARFNIPFIWNSAGDWHKRPCKSPVVHPDLALLLSTSGSTGGPKLVKLTLDNLQANATSIALYLGIDEKERPITSLPIHYSYGLSVLNSHLAKAARILLTAEPVTSRAFWDFFRANEASSFAGVPATYSLLKQLRFERMALPTLRTMTQAGGQLTADLTCWIGELAKSRGQRFFVMYGQTEATARISYVPAEHLLEKVGSIGIPIPGSTIALVDDNGNSIAGNGVVGQLRYSGPNVMMGYAECESDLAYADAQNGSLLTGDLASRDEDGYYYLRGRLKRFIKVFGNRIGLDEVEGQLREKGFDVAVTGRDDLLVIALRGSQADCDSMTTDVCAMYRLHHSAIRVVTVDSFPMSSAGKIQYADLLNEIAP